MVAVQKVRAFNITQSERDPVNTRTIYCFLIQITTKKIDDDNNVYT